jgi:hypothetical protein
MACQRFSVAAPGVAVMPLDNQKKFAILSWPSMVSANQVLNL